MSEYTLISVDGPCNYYDCTIRLFYQGLCISVTRKNDSVLWRGVHSANCAVDLDGPLHNWLNDQVPKPLEITGITVMDLDSISRQCVTFYCGDIWHSVYIKGDCFSARKGFDMPSTDMLNALKATWVGKLL